MLRGKRCKLVNSHKCRRFEVPTPPAANSVRNFKSKSGTRNHSIASAPLFPKFVRECAEMYHELRKRGTSRTLASKAGEQHNHAPSIAALTPRSASGVSTSTSAPFPVTGTSTTASP